MSSCVVDPKCLTRSSCSVMPVFLDDFKEGCRTEHSPPSFKEERLEELPEG